MRTIVRFAIAIHLIIIFVYLTYIFSLSNSENFNDNHTTPFQNSSFSLKKCVPRSEKFENVQEKFRVLSSFHLAIYFFYYWAKMFTRTLVKKFIYIYNRLMQT